MTAVEEVEALVKRWGQCESNARESTFVDVGQDYIINKTIERTAARVVEDLSAILTRLKEQE